MKDTFYFSHDYNAATDEKIVKMLSRHGMTGYGIFWRTIEMLYNNANALDLDYDRIAYELRFSDTDIISSVINDFNLFIVSDGQFGSASIERRLDERDEKSEKARQSAFHRWRKDAAIPESNTNASKNDSNASKNDSNASKNDAINKGKKEKKEYIVDFARFWDLYNKKNGDKARCEVKWKKLTGEDQTRIIEILPRYLKTIKDKQYQPYPETFLNQRRWENEDLLPVQEVDSEGTARPGPEYCLVNGKWTVL